MGLTRERLIYSQGINYRGCGTVYAGTGGAEPAIVYNKIYITPYSPRTFYIELVGSATVINSFPIPSEIMSPIIHFYLYKYKLNPTATGVIYDTTIPMLSYLWQRMSAGLFGTRTLAEVCYPVTTFASNPGGWQDTWGQPNTFRIRIAQQLVTVSGVYTNLADVLDSTSYICVKFRKNAVITDTYTGTEAIAPLTMTLGDLIQAFKSNTGIVTGYSTKAFILTNNPCPPHTYTCTVSQVGGIQTFNRSINYATDVTNWVNLCPAPPYP